MQGEGHSADGWGIGGSVELLLQVQSPFVRAMDVGWKMTVKTIFVRVSEFQANLRCN